ncbi:MAG: TrkA family potassium uptake protein [Candidatus Latescibacterota bacterium]|nr:MAG: TrkA family potassium uptake protein [Candidatus Latescibacterota bacterium]
MQFAVIGLGQFGFKVATTLAAKGAEVLAVDSNPDVIEQIKDQVTQAICLDSTDERALRSLGLQDMDAVVMAIGEGIEASILTTALLKRLRVKRIIARATSQIHGLVLKEVGAEKVVYPEDQMGEQLAKSLLAPHVVEQITLQTGHSLAQIRPRKEFISKTIRELDFRARFGLNIIAIHKKIPIVTETGESSFKVQVNDLPTPEDRIEENDLLVVIGPDEKIQRLAEG